MSIESKVIELFCMTYDLASLICNFVSIFE